MSAYRFRQRSPTRATFDVVPGAGWTDGTATAIAHSLRTELPAGLEIDVTVVEAIDRSAGGKRSTIVRDG